MFARGNPEPKSCLDASGSIIISQLLIGLSDRHVELGVFNSQYDIMSWISL